METKTVEKYLEKRVFVILKSGFRYTFNFKKENLIGNTISISDKFNETVDFSISDIILIKEAKKWSDNVH